MQVGQKLLTAGDRPASVFYRGGEVRIDVHDAWHERTCKRLKADIVALHPDKAQQGFRRRGGMSRKVIKATAYRYALRNLKLWMEEQTRWYAVFGLRPLRVIGMEQVNPDKPIYTKIDVGSSYVPTSKPEHRWDESNTSPPKPKAMIAKAGVGK